MPYYQYQNPKTLETEDVFQHMDEEHRYIKDGVEWNRLFEPPMANIDSLANIDPFNKQEFKDKTKNFHGTHGDLLDLSAELSQKRSRVVGKDPVKEATANEYKKRTGKAHPLA